MNPNDRATLWHLLMALLGGLLLAWALLPRLQPMIAVGFALWLVGAAFLLTRER
jgi:hypothetical protein